MICVLTPYQDVPEFSALKGIKWLDLDKSLLSAKLFDMANF